MKRPNTIERSISVSSPIERVWEAVTVAEHLAAWFGDSAEIELVPGGEFTIGWSEESVMTTAVVEEVEAPNRFVYRWSVGQDEHGTVWTTEVRFTLESTGDTTLVTVVESGFADLPDAVFDASFEENSSGWTHELADLGRYLGEVAMA